MGTIAQKLTYLNGTKQALKESINNLGGDITSETTFREYAQELDNIYDNLPKVEGEGTNLSLTTLKGKMNIQVKGDTSQNGTPTPSTPIDIEVVTGTQEVKVENKNLLPTPYVYDSRTINGITFTINNDYSISASGTATGNATFVLLNETSPKLEDIRKLLLNNSCTLSGCPSGGSSSSYRLQLYGRGSAGTGTSVDYGSGVAITNFENTSNNFNIAIFIPSGTTMSTPIIFKPQLEKRKCSNTIYTTPRTNTNSKSRRYRTM